MNTACPTCGTEYAVEAKDVGRRIACAKCGTHLTVNESGLQADPIQAAQARPEKHLTTVLAPIWKRADWPTLGVGIGAVLVLWFIFMPIVGATNVDRQTAILSEATLTHASRIKELRERNADARQIGEVEEAWQKRREQLQDEAKLAEYSRAQGLYWDRYGLLLGCIVLAAGSIGWTRSDQPLTRRIAGAVLLTIQLGLALQTATPLGCSSPGRSYNSGANPLP